MKAAFLALACALPALVRAQDVVVARGADRNSGAFIREAASQTHVVIAGTGRLELPRDSTVASTLIVLGRDTYLASTVKGNVVVVGAHLFLRPGVDISGHAVAIGGTVANTALGRVGGRIESYPDDTYDVTARAGGYTLDFRPLALHSTIPLVRPAGIMGVVIPRYDRVDGLSLPVGAIIAFMEGAIEAEPTVTYRSRLGAFDPGVALRVNAERATHFEARVARDTRSNETWIYNDLVNSATAFFAGSDTRNYFRSDLAEARLFTRLERTGRVIEPFVGVRYERVSPITAVGNVYSVTGRTSETKMARPNPLVPKGDIGSILAGGELHDTSGVVTTRLRAEAEQSFETVAGTANFLQVTLDARVGFPTILNHRLAVRGHAVVTPARGVTPARYAYLGGSGTMSTLELLEIGGDELLFVESRYLIPLANIVLPMVGSPSVTLRDVIGSAGVDGLPPLYHAIGVGVGLSALRMDYQRDVSGRATHPNKFSVGISIGK